MGAFECDCRAVGTNWDRRELQTISDALLGTTDIIPRPSEMAAEFEPHSDRITMMSDPYLIVRPEGSWEAPGVLDGSAEHGGERRHWQRVVVFHVRDGAITEQWIHDSDQHVVEEVLAQ